MNIGSAFESFRERTTRPLFDYVRQLSPGDRIIASALFGLLGLSLLLGLYGLERQFLVEQPAHGGSLTEGVLGTPRFVHPLLALSDVDRDLVALTFAGLMGYGADGNLTPVLAERYEVSEDGKTYTFIIRKDAKFSDGKPVTAQDVVFTVERAQDPGLKSPERANWANIIPEVVDARTVRFTLPKPYPPFLEEATLGIIPAHIWRGVTNEEFPFHAAMTNPVGAGPFTVTGAKRGSDGTIVRYTLSAFSGYAPGRPYLSELRLVFFTREAELAAALRSGSVESAHGVTAERARSVPYSRVFGVFFNASENPLYTELAVRKALSLAIDRENITEVILGGYATPAWSPVPPGAGRVDREEIIGTFTTDEARLARAREILEDNEWSFDEEAGLWTNEELQLSVALKTSNVPELKEVAAAIRDDWQRLGVPVEIELYDPSELTQSVIRPRQFEALLFGMVVGREQDLFAFWSSSERNDPGLNIALYANRAVDTLLEEIRQETDPEARAEAIAEADELIALDYPAAFTHAPDFLYTVPENLKGLALTSVAAPSDRFQNVAHWYRHTEMVWPAFARE